MSLDHRMIRPTAVAALLLFMAQALGAQWPATSPVRAFAAQPGEATMLYSLSGLEQATTLGPSLQRFPQDPADSLYREARQLMNRGEYRKAAAAFAKVASHQPPSAYAADALYWQSFALYRIGGTAELRQALAALETRRAKYPDARSETDATTLATRIRGALAARGDAAAAAQVARQAQSASASCDADELSVRSSALSALMKADPSAAQPLLERVLARKDECSVPLRRSAVLMIGANADAVSRAKLASVARSDPSATVRSEAIGYLAKVPGDEVVTTLEQVIRADDDDRVKRSAIRALGAHESPRARAAIRALIERADAPEALRLDALSTLDRGYSFTFTDCSEGACTVLGASTPRPPATPMPPMAPRPATAPVATVNIDPIAIELASERSAERAAERAAGAAERAAERIASRSASVTNLNRVSVDGSWQQPARRLSADDATWLRNLYPRLETTRLQARAAAVLARSGDEATLAWLTALVQRDEAPADVRATVISRLGRDLPIASLNRLYDNAGSRTVRQQIISTLGERKEPEATDKLIEIVRTGTDASLRRSAINALGRKKDPRTTQLLLELIDK